MGRGSGGVANGGYGTTTCRWHGCCSSGFEVFLFHCHKDTNMRNAQILAATALLASPLAWGQAPAAAPATPEHSFTGKVALYSEYEYRGQSQTSEDPALQLTL